MKYTIKRIKLDKRYSCISCHRDIGKSEYVLFQENHGFACIRHIEERIDMFILAYTNAVKEYNKKIKYEANTSYYTDSLNRHIIEYKQLIKELRKLKRYYMKNKELLINKSLIANI